MIQRKMFEERKASLDSENFLWKG